jgi:hypothetical protein
LMIGHGRAARQQQCRQHEAEKCPHKPPKRHPPAIAGPFGSRSSLPRNAADSSTFAGFRQRKVWRAGRSFGLLMFGQAGKSVLPQGPTRPARPRRPACQAYSA